ncbi:ArsC/Spx/MgsR family protein [Lactococcus garvieae]|uniref:ArsC/Spx/MgsR family protein n=1 Tax=Lactococcus garvieae TaxID=1363 RepID=UPI00254E1FA1|nr:ArsC/Spx/MgsR family protein [Lactococcus garvieae]
MGYKMITCYHEKRNLSSRKTVKWLEDRQINIHLKRVTHISKKDLLQILSLSNQGFQDIVKAGTKLKGEDEEFINKIRDMSFNEAIRLILKYPEVLRTPIVMENNKLMIGFNSENIRQFLPKNYRKQKNSFE